jgi:hypothetical protein
MSYRIRAAAVARDALAAWAQAARPRTSGGVGSRCIPPARTRKYGINTAGLHATAAVGLDGRLEFDSSNRGLC